jgi:hypothetical protein
MRELMIIGMSYVFGMNIYLMWLMHRMRQHLNSGAWFFIFGGFVAWFFFTVVGLYIAIFEETPTRVKLTAVAFLVAKATCFVLGFSCYYLDYCEAMEIDPQPLLATVFSKPQQWIRRYLE